MIEKILRVQRAETNTQAARRFLNIQDEANRKRVYRKNIPWQAAWFPHEGDAGLNGLVDKVSKGPSIRREIVLFDRIKLPFSEKRRPKEEWGQRRHDRHDHFKYFEPQTSYNNSGISRRLIRSARAINNS
ncbi:MAG: hypothetical protein A2798_01170 [Candidatus Levybacteria bacterium RIFCSPHIGHO2_01_FULL_37_17]|nr:MAG: hypothetical protein A2798_01170 [Candidatus Levybacteria bacterium RIFCSPHIGHO2_01_FULL_37_17]OGH37063.1 MAG: hypothetical protein A2959_02030 [Candidatus Levybacteria bacterium RIFCSPLOWO2_01_FULL_38_23]